MHTLASARYNHYYIGMGNYIVLDQFPLPMSSKMCVNSPFSEISNSIHQWELLLNVCPAFYLFRENTPIFWLR
jgi:hypothetical protein